MRLVEKPAALRGRLAVQSDDIQRRHAHSGPLEEFMSESERQEPSISEEAEAAAQADRTRLFESRIPRISDQAVTGRLSESIGRALGLDADKISGQFADDLQALGKQLLNNEPPPLGRMRIPPSGE